MDKNGISVRFVPNDVAVQQTATGTSRQQILELERYLKLAGQPEEERMYEAPRRKYSWLRMVTDVYNDVQSCQGCARMCTKVKHRRTLQLFPAAVPLEFINVVIIGTASKEKKWKQTRRCYIRQIH